MAVTSADLMVPKGPVDAKLFPGLASRAVSARLDGYITAAVNEPAVILEPDAAKKDAMVRPRALYFVFRDVYIDMVRRPAQLAVTDEGSHAFIRDQLLAMEKLRDGYLAEYEALLPVPVVQTRMNPGTMSTGIRVNWS